MPIVKKANAKRMTDGAIVLDFGDLRVQADRMIEAAQLEATRLIQHANTVANARHASADELGHQKGYERGYAEGLERGRLEGLAEAREEHREQFAALESAWTGALARWERDRGKMLANAREDVLSLALEIARKIVLRVPEIDPTVVQDQLEETLRLVTSVSSLVVEVHPDDRPLIEPLLDDLLRRLAGGGHARLTESEAIGRGGVVVHTERGRIDATITAQIERVVNGLLPRPVDSSRTDSSSGDSRPPGAGDANATDG